MSGRQLCRGLVTAAAPASGLRQVLAKQLVDIKAAGTWKKERVITSAQAAHISVQGSHGQVWTAHGFVNVL